MENDTRRNPRPCMLSHPAFGINIRCRSLKDAARFIIFDYLRDHLNRNDIYIDISIIKWLLDNKIILQSEDNTFPLNGLQVLPDTKWEREQKIESIMRGGLENE